jgi:PucR-like helix-turn-helix protein/diguanylate cyclase with GGDEF domain
MTEFASLPADTSDGLQPTLAAVAKAVADRAEQLVDVLGEAVNRKSGLSEVDPILPHDDVGAAACSANIRSILAAMVDKTRFDSALATKIGVERARNKTALSSLLAGDRIGFRRLWDVVANEAARHPSINGVALRSLTARAHAAEDLYMNAMVTGYRDERRRQVLGETPRTVLIDLLLHGRILDDWSLWEGANLLRLPRQGPFVVIAAALPAVGVEALPGIECKLASLDVHSAWRLLPDVQIGIAHVKSDHKFDEVVALVCRVAVNRVGVSARFDDLRDTPHALHCAKVTLRGCGDGASRVAVFDGSILATAVVSAPEIMVKSVGDALNGFRDLADEDRDILVDTFRVWQDNDSVSVTAQQLVVHPNTVRHRLRRIEKHTGRSLSRPRDVAELCLAFEVHRRLM